VSGVATVAATLPLALLPTAEYGRAGEVAFLAATLATLGALLLVPQLINLVRRLSGLATRRHDKPSQRSPAR
jgi:hypothetical protein